MRVLRTFGRTESAKSGDTPSHCPLERNVDQTSEKFRRARHAVGRGLLCATLGMMLFLCLLSCLQPQASGMPAIGGGGCDVEVLLRNILRYPGKSIPFVWKRGSWHEELLACNLKLSVGQSSAIRKGEPETFVNYYNALLKSLQKGVQSEMQVSTFRSLFPNPSLYRKALTTVVSCDIGEYLRISSPEHLAILAS